MKNCKKFAKKIINHYKKILIIIKSYKKVEKNTNHYTKNYKYIFIKLNEYSLLNLTII